MRTKAELLRENERLKDQERDFQKGIRDLEQAIKDLARLYKFDEAYLTLQPLLSHAAATVFGLSLVAAGLSSTVVGTLAGQVVMQGFIRFHIPLWVRRTVTMLPSFIVILMGLDPTRILVMSQVLLSFGIALALVPLLIFTSDSKLMGDLVNSKRVKQTGWVIVVLVVALNIWLLVGTALGL